MEIKEIRSKSVKELEGLVSQKKETLRQLRFSLNSDSLKDPSQVKKTKKDIAKILTVLKEKNK